MPCTICGCSERLPNEPNCIGVPSFGWTVATQERATSVTKGGMTVKLFSLTPGEKAATCCAEKAAPSMSWKVSDESSNVQPSQYSLWVRTVSPAANLACSTPASFG
eukprot:4551266-Prymnesium_polylepis.1